jgi:sigma-B regulation protein RsbU (phosphoserine phosphatase)
LAIILMLLDGDVRFGATNFGVNFVALGGILIFVVLALELSDRITMKRDLEIAREIQQWLVPESPPDVPGIDIAFATRPQNTVAGDCYDAFMRPAAGPADSPKLLIAVADVAGKSVPAAMLMATFQASLSTLAGTQATFEDIAVGLDRYGREHNMGGRRFTTAFLAEIDPPSGTMRHINAGHNAPILLRASGRMERLEIGGLPLGLPILKGTETRFECGQTKLERGDLLFIFTDGLIEAVTDDGEEFGEPRLINFLNARPEGKASVILARAMNEVNTFVGTARQHDDITCLLLKMER